MNWNINKTYTTRRLFPYRYIVHLFNILAHNSYTLQNTQINHSNKDTFYHQNNIYTTTSKQFLGQAGNKLEQQYTYWYVSIYRSDTCIGPASSLAEISALVIQSIFILKYHINAIPVCSPVKCYLKWPYNGCNFYQWK